MIRPPAYNIPGIPAAPVGRKFLVAVDRDFLARKERLGDKIPLLTKEEVAKRKNPYHVVLMNEMMMEGYFPAVHELHKILRKEEAEIISKKGSRKKILDEPDKVYRIANVLKICQDYSKEGNYEAITLIRIDLGEYFLKSSDIWLAKHFLYSVLKEAKKMEDDPHKYKIQAEAHCLLAFIARDNASNLEEALESAVNHLVLARELARDQPWQFKMNTITIRLKKPIAIHGLRDEYEIIDGSSMSLYFISTLLEHEMLIGLANEILHSKKVLTEEELKQSHVFADKALQFAYEVLHPVALNSALLRFGIVLRHAHEYDDALYYFHQLAHHAEVTSDQECLAIAYHNIALCELGKQAALSAMVSLVKQKNIADMFDLPELSADALEELGRLLLMEGQLGEAECSFEVALEKFTDLKHENKDLASTTIHDHLNICFIMRAISAGQKLWSRFAGLVRSENYATTVALIEWKLERKPLPRVGRPNYQPDRIDDVMEKFRQQDMSSRKSTFDPQEESSPGPLTPKQSEPEFINFDLKGLDSVTYLSDYRAPKPVASSKFVIHETITEPNAAQTKLNVSSASTRVMSAKPGESAIIPEEQETIDAVYEYGYEE